MSKRKMTPEELAAHPTPEDRRNWVPEKSDGRTAWWGNCEDCGVCVVVYPHPESLTDIDSPEDWETFPSCYVCDGRIDWGGSDPVGEIIKGYGA